jgi:hypothetical protein
LPGLLDGHVSAAKRVPHACEGGHVRDRAQADRGSLTWKGDRKAARELENDAPFTVVSFAGNPSQPVAAVDDQRAEPQVQLLRLRGDGSFGSAVHPAPATKRVRALTGALGNHPRNLTVTPDRPESA